MSFFKNISGLSDIELSQKIRISDQELQRIFDLYYKEINELLLYMREEEEEMGSIIVEDEKELSFLLSGNILHLYYVESEFKKKNKYNELLNDIYNDFDHINDEEQWLKDKLRNQGVSTTLISELDDLQND